MIAWTTSQVTVKVPVDLTGADVLVTIKQQQSYAAEPVVIEDASPTVTAGASESIVAATFSQQQTGQLTKGCAKLQCNWVFQNGTRGAITAVEVPIFENVKGEALAYGD